MPASVNYRGQKFVQAPWASGATTASAIQAPGYAVYGLILPVITSGAISPLVGASAEAAPVPVYDKVGAIISAATPGGTGGAAIDSTLFNAIAAYPVFTISGAAQASARTITWCLKG